MGFGCAREDAGATLALFSEVIRSPALAQPKVDLYKAQVSPSDAASCCILVAQPTAAYRRMCPEVHTAGQQLYTTAKILGACSKTGLAISQESHEPTCATLVQMSFQ